MLSYNFHGNLISKVVEHKKQNWIGKITKARELNQLSQLSQLSRLSKSLYSPLGQPLNQHFTI